jgi:hypothetical protein
MASKKKMTAKEVEQRLQALEEVAHVPFDFTDLMKSLKRLDAQVDAILKGDRKKKKK